MTYNLYGQVRDFPGCCGAQIFFGLIPCPEPRRPERDLPLTVAITAGRQRAQAKQLEARGYVPVLRFRGRTGASLTLWTYTRAKGTYLVKEK